MDLGPCPATGCMGPVTHARGLYRPLLEMLYWTFLCEVSGLFIAHMIRHCHVIQHCWVSHGFGVLMIEDLGRAGALVLFESFHGGFFRGSWGRHHPGALLHHHSDLLCWLNTAQHPAHPPPPPPRVPFSMLHPGHTCSCGQLPHAQNWRPQSHLPSVPWGHNPSGSAVSPWGPGKVTSRLII